MVAPNEVNWTLSPSALSSVAEFRNDITEYNASKAALQCLLCNYFSNGNCIGKLGSSISPVECGIANAKGLKVRWLLPGRGKSGGLRLAVIVFCEDRRVIIAGAWMRREDPGDEEFATAFAEAAE